MLTISAIKNTGGAAQYYAKEDNYYLAEADAKESSQWWGKGASELGLGGKIEEKELQRLLEGRLPNGVIVGLQRDGTINHRAGFDLCFHAPKSVSILALDGEDKRFYNAHLDAVCETLKIIQRDAAQSKVFQNGQVRFENTKNLTIALVRHSTSRELDLHLHHHALVMNATKRQDNAWRALGSSMAKNKAQVNGFFERIHNNQIYYGLIYKSALANKVRNLGCELEVVGKHGMWEIKGVPKEARDVMSKRRLQIEERIDKLNYRSLKAADMVALDTREKKSKNIKLGEIKQTWKAELASVGFSSKEFIAQLDNSRNERAAYEKNGKNEKNEKYEKNALWESNVNVIASSKKAKEAEEATRDATEHLSQYKLKLDYAKIIAQALEFSIGKSTHSDIVTALNGIIKDGQLIPLDKSGSTFVTKELIEVEKIILDIVGRSKSTNAEISLKNKVLDSISEGEAKKHAINVLQSKSRMNLIEHRLAENTEFVSAVLKLAESSGKTVRILSPNRMMANDINENIKRKPNNLWQWLVSLGKPEIGESVAGFKHKYKEEVDLPLLRFRQGKDVIVVNNAETLGCGDMHSLLELTEKTKAKVIFLQDVNARRGFGAGNPIETLKQAGVETFKIDTKADRIISYVPELKAVPDINERTKQLAHTYALREERECDRTAVFVGSKELLKSTNEAIREELKSHGKLSGIEHSISALNPIYMSKPETTLAHKYPKNAVIRFYNTGSVNKDWNIESINKEKNTLRLIRNGKRMLWSPRIQEKQKKQKKTNYAVFKKEELRVAIGDKLIATGNMNDLGIKNATRFVIQNINKKRVELLSGTKIFKVSLDNFQEKHFQYDYATTISKSSKKQVAHIIADMKAYSLDKATINELTSRAQETLTIFTNDAEIAQKNFGRIPVKLTATETLLYAGKVVGANQVDRFINDKTISEIKDDIGKVITILGAQYELAEKPERRAVDFAIEKITSRNAGFTHKELVAEALTYALKEQEGFYGNAVSHEDIMKVVVEKRASGELVMGKYFDDGTRWTTKEILELEKTIIDDIKKGRNKLNPFLDQKTATSLIENTNLTQDQKNACYLITTTKDQFVVIQGYAGTGKTTMFSQVQSMLKESRELKEIKDAQEAKEVNTGQDRGSLKENQKTKEVVEMLALAPTHRAVKELKSIDIEAQTLKSFLIEHRTSIASQKINDVSVKSDNNCPSHNVLDNKLIVLDEASMVSNKDFVRFLNIVGRSNGRVVLSGDIAQHIAVGSGKPFEIVQKSNILKTAYLREIVRQKNPNLREAVESVIHKDYASAFEKIANENPQSHIERMQTKKGEKAEITNSFDGILANRDRAHPDFLDFFNNLKKSIVEVDNNELKVGEKTLEHLVAEDFLSRVPDTRDKTVIIVHANDDRRVITDFIRKGLKEQGEIRQEGVKVNCLIPKGLTDAEHKSLGSYNKGDVVKFGKEYYHVIENDKLSKSLLLQNEAGKPRHFYPEKYVDKYNVELYEHIKAELVVGDTIRLTKTDKERKLYANFEYIVKKCNNSKVILEGWNNDGKNKQQCKHGNQKNLEKPKKIILNPKELKDAHWDYAQTVTGYGIQGGSKTYVIDFEVSYRKHLANQRSFYIGASRAIEHITIYTDDKEKLLNRIVANKGDKYAALEVMGDVGASNNNVNYSESGDKATITTRVTKTEIQSGSIRKENKSHLDFSGFLDVKEISRLLSNSAESFVERLLGRPNEKLSSASQWRYGNKGSFVISMSGDKKGLWHNFETGESGNLLTLIQKEIGLSFRETLKYVSSMFSDGLYMNASKRHQQHKIDKVPINLNLRTCSRDSKGDKEGKIREYAQKLVAESQPMVGTVVEKYLKETRGINNIDSFDIRYHPKVYVGKNEEQKHLPVMLACGRDKDGKIQCVQATYLDSRTANKANIAVKKRTYASPSGASVLLQRHDAGIKNNITNKMTFISEGVETGLSIKDAVKNGNVVVTLGKANFVSIEPQSVGQKIVFCLDNDGMKSFADNTIHKAAQRLIDFGKEVFIAVPDQINNAKTDYNDVARISGINSVKNNLDNSMPYHIWKSNLEASLKDIKNDEISTKLIKRMIHKEVVNDQKLYNPSQKNIKINLDKATNMFHSERKPSFTMEPGNRHEQNNLPVQNTLDNRKNIKVNQNVQSMQKGLAKSEREIY
jgi:conjugative transfer relaxase protein TraI